MSAEILDGVALAKKLKDDLKAEIDGIKAKNGQIPKIVNVIVGSDPGSCSYARSQQKCADYIGLNYELKSLPADISQEEFVSQLKALNDDSSVNGIMIHKPVPEHIQYGEVANCVDPIKDLEGVNVTNIGKMILGKTKMYPCTPASVMEHIRSTSENIKGKEAVIIGHSQIVGKPLSLLLLDEYATVTVCHIGTSEAGKLEEHVKRAEILVVAVGRPGLIKGEWIKEGAIVIDVGINQVDNKIVGDVEFDQAKTKASFITPVPGGVGPVTVVMLMRNGIEAYHHQNQLKDKLRV